MSARNRNRRALSRSVAVATTLVASLVFWPVSAVQAAPPANDDPSAAVVVSSLPFSTTVDTTEATFSTADPFGCGVATVWYSFTPTTTGEYAVRASSSEVAPVVAVRGRPFGDECYRTASANVSFVAGSTYLIMAGTDGIGDPGQVGPGGSLVVTVDGPFAPFAATVAVGRVVLGSAPNTVDVTGTLACNRTDASALLSGGVTQVRGRRVAEAFFGLGIACPESPTPWTTTANVATGPVLPGLATIDIQFSACTFPTCVVGTVRTTLPVRAR